MGVFTQRSEAMLVLSLIEDCKILPKMYDPSRSGVVALPSF